MENEQQMRAELEQAKAGRADALAELALLEQEHARLAVSVRNALRLLRTELGAEGAVSALEAGLVWRVGDTLEDRARKLARLSAVG